MKVNMDWRRLAWSLLGSVIVTGLMAVAVWLSVRFWYVAVPLLFGYSTWVFYTEEQDDPADDESCE